MITISDEVSAIVTATKSHADNVIIFNLSILYPFKRIGDSNLLSRAHRRTRTRVTAYREPPDYPTQRRIVYHVKKFRSMLKV